MLKDDYIETIKRSGFKNISIANESVYPIGSLISDPEVKSAIKKYKLSRAQVRNYAKKVLSIKLSGIK